MGQYCYFLYFPHDLKLLHEVLLCLRAEGHRRRNELHAGLSSKAEGKGGLAVRLWEGVDEPAQVVPPCQPRSSGDRGRGTAVVQRQPGPKDKFQASKTLSGREKMHSLMRWAHLDSDSSCV